MWFSQTPRNDFPNKTLSKAEILRQGGKIETARDRETGKQADMEKTERGAGRGNGGGRKGERETGEGMEFGEEDGKKRKERKEDKVQEYVNKNRKQH